MFKKEIRGAIIALVLISVGGLLLHLRIHPPYKAPGQDEKVPQAVEVIIPINTDAATATDALPREKKPEARGKWDLFDLTPAVFCVLGIIILPILFNSARTVAWAYMLNILAVIVGTVTMAYYSWDHWEGPLTLSRLVLHTTLADILILAAKLPLGHMILRHFRPRPKGGA